LFSPSCKQHNNKESSATDLFERLNFEQSFFKIVFLRNSFLQKFIKNNLCKVSRRRAQDRNPSETRPSRPTLQKTGLETRLETETESRDSITGLNAFQKQAKTTGELYSNSCISEKCISALFHVKTRGITCFLISPAADIRNVFKQRFDENT